jgi:hypothetical protein
MSKAWRPFARNEENVPGVFSAGLKHQLTGVAEAALYCAHGFLTRDMRDKRDGLDGEAWWIPTREASYLLP